MSTVVVEIPSEALELAALASEVPSSSASKLIALELFREGRVSLGRAAELAGLGVEAFMEFSAHRQVPLQYGEGELAEDRETAARLRL